MSLTEVSFNIRKFLPFVIFFSVIFLIFFYVIQLFFTLVSNKPTTIHYDPVFGKIEEPQFPKTATLSANFTFNLDTIEGRPTTATTSGAVYFLPESATRFGYREKLYLMAKTMGFDTDLIKYQLIGENAVFNDEKQTLTANIKNFNFNYEYDYKKDPSIFNDVIIPSQDVIIENATQFLKNVARYPEELAQGKTHIIYFNYDQVANTLRVVESPQDANVVEVDFYRSDIPGDPQALPVVSPEYFTSQNHIIMVFTGQAMKPLKAQISFFEKSEEQIGIYPLRTGDEAWEDLKSGKGYIISNTNSGSDITIKKMFLGYYDPEENQNYLQPIYVFLGDNNFVAFVPAVSKEYLVEE